MLIHVNLCNFILIYACLFTSPSWLDTFRTLFWVIFGYGEVEYADIVVDNTCDGLDPTFNETCGVASHKFTEGTGYFLWGLYHLLMVATLLNMLIGLMANTLNHIQV